MVFNQVCRNAFGVQFARRSIFMPKLLRPDAAGLLALLWGVHRKLERIPPPPLPGLTSFDADPQMPKGFLEAAGFRVIGPRAIRLDMLDRLEDELEKAAASGESAEAATPKLVSLLGTDKVTLEAVLKAMGWTAIGIEGETARTVWRRHERAKPKPARKKRKPHKKTVKSKKIADPDSPFASLKSLIAAD